TCVVFSLMQGIFPPYYSVALAPAVGALVGLGGVALWRLRSVPWVRLALAGTVAVTTWWSYTLLGRSPGWYPWLRTAVLAVGLLSAAALLVGPALTRAVTVVLAAAVLFTALGGPAADALQTASSAHRGAIPSAGPAVAGGFGPGRGFPGGGPPPGSGSPPGGALPGLPSAELPGAVLPGGPGMPPGGPGMVPGGPGALAGGFPPPGGPGWMPGGGVPG